MYFARSGCLTVPSLIPSLRGALGGDRTKRNCQFTLSFRYARTVLSPAPGQNVDVK